MEKPNSVFSYILTGFISFLLLGGLAAGMFYIGREYTLREVGTAKENPQDDAKNKDESSNIQEPQKTTVEYNTKEFTISKGGFNNTMVTFEASIPNTAQIAEASDGTATIINDNASLKFFMIDMGFPKPVRKYEIIPNTNFKSKLYRVTFKDGKISYVTDYEEKDITKCSNPDITPTLPCGLSIHTNETIFLTEFTGKEDDLEVFDKIMSSLNQISVENK